MVLKGDHFLTISGFIPSLEIIFSTSSTILYTPPNPKGRALVMSLVWSLKCPSHSKLFLPAAIAVRSTGAFYCVPSVCMSVPFISSLIWLSLVSYIGDGYSDIMDIWTSWIFGYHGYWGHHGYLDIMDNWTSWIFGHHSYSDIMDIRTSWIVGYHRYLRWT